jgi:hypothetical protein
MSKSPLGRSRRSKEFQSDQPSDNRFGRKPAWNTIGPSDSSVMAENLRKNDVDFIRQPREANGWVHHHVTRETVPLPTPPPTSSHLGTFAKDHFIASAFRGRSHHEPEGESDAHGGLHEKCMPLEEHRRMVNDLERKIRKGHGEAEALRYKCDELESLTEEMAQHIKKLNQSMTVGAHSHVIFSSPESKIKSILSAHECTESTANMRIPILSDIHGTKFLPCTWVVAFCRRTEEILGEMSLSSLEAGDWNEEPDHHNKTKHYKKKDLNKFSADDDADLAASMLLTRARVLGMELWSLRKIFADQQKQIHALEPEHKLARRQLDDVSRQREVEAAAHAETMMIMSQRMQSLETTLSSFAHHQADHVSRMHRRIGAYVPDALTRATHAGVNFAWKDVPSSGSASPRFPDVCSEKVALDDLEKVLAASMTQIAERLAELLRERHALIDATETARAQMETLEESLQAALRERDAVRDEMASMQEAHKAAMQRASQRAEERLKAASVAALARDTRTDQLVFSAMELLVQGVAEMQSKTALAQAVCSVKDSLVRAYRRVTAHSANADGSATCSTDPHSKNDSSIHVSSSRKATRRLRVAAYAVVAQGRLRRLLSRRIRTRYDRQRTFTSIDSLSALADRLSGVRTSEWDCRQLCSSLFLPGEDARLFDQWDMRGGWMTACVSRPDVIDKEMISKNSQGGHTTQHSSAPAAKAAVPRTCAAESDSNFPAYLLAAKTDNLAADGSFLGDMSISVLVDASVELEACACRGWDWSAVWDTIRRNAAELSQVRCDAFY